MKMEHQMQMLRLSSKDRMSDGDRMTNKHREERIWYAIIVDLRAVPVLFRVFRFQEEIDPVFPFSRYFPLAGKLLFVATGLEQLHLSRGK